MSQTRRHALDELDLVVQSCGYPVAVTIPDVMDDWLTPPCQRPCHPFQRLLGTLAGALNQLQQRLARRFFLGALAP
jgi:hypothetical protein